jgi:ribokinase
MAKQPHICVVGSSNIDLTFRTSRLPEAGETLTASGFRLGHGGKGANQAVAAARLGARVSMVTRIGHGGRARIARPRHEPGNRDAR